MAQDLGGGEVKRRKVYLVRHGETVANASRELQGQRDNPLNEIGRAQAQALAERLREEPIEICFSSDLVRARETAELLAFESGVRIVLCPELRERCFGEFEGRPMAEYEASLAASALPYEQFCPDRGESVENVRERVTAFLQTLSAGRYEGPVLIVAHAGTNKVLLSVLLGAASAPCGQSNACLNLLELDGSGAATPVFLNCVRHLETKGIRHLAAYE